MNGSSTQCKKCSEIQNGKKRRTGCGLISGNMWSQIKSNAKRKNIPFELRIEEAWNKFISQQGKCLFTNVDIKLYGYEKDKKPTAKLILNDPQLGYIPNNIAWIHKDIIKFKKNNLEKL
jgi:hypothetical protein